MHQFILTLFTLSVLLLSSKAQTTPKDFLKAHNAARAHKGIGPMKWDDTVASYAVHYANKRKDCSLIHSGGQYGENIAFSSDPAFSARDAVRMWMSEKRYYDYASNSCALGEYECLHYTQIMWRNSTCLGCGSVRCNDGGVFVICSYNPPGNYVGQRPY